MKNDIDSWMPDLPFSEQEFFEAYLRLYPEPQAREYARRLTGVPGQIRRGLREQAKEGPVYEWPRLFIDDEVFASLALISPELEHRVTEYKEREWVENTSNYRLGLIRRHGFADDADPPEWIVDIINDYSQNLRDTWLRTIRRVARIHDGEA